MSDPSLIAATKRRLGELAWDRAATVTVAWAVAVICLVVVGLVVRVQYIEYRPINSDEAAVGLMAAQMLHGHFTAFYWGQYYGGSLEPFLIAVGFAVFGQSAAVLTAVPAVLAAVAAVLTWRIGGRLGLPAGVAALTGAVVWVAPQAAVENSAYEWGFRGVTMVCGLAAILSALRLGTARRPLPDAALLGLALGIGWWSSPEIIYYALPALLMAAVSFRHRCSTESVPAVRYAGTAGTVAGAFVVGAFPWIWANVGSHLESLSQSKFGLPRHAPGYFGHLRIFGEYSLGLLFSLRTSRSWLGGRPVGVTLLVLLLAVVLVALVLCARRRGPVAALAVGVAAFPFLLATSPAVWYWQDGRYVGYVVPLLALVVAAGLATPARTGAAPRRTAGRRSRSRRAGPARSGPLLLSLVGAVAVAASLIQYHHNRRGLPAQGDPNAVPAASARALVAQGVRYGYAGYWAAYYLAFLSHEQLIVAATLPVRRQAITRQVEAAPSAAWLFVPDPHDVAYFSGSKSSRGPDDLTEAAFERYLSNRHIGYRVISAGVVQAVVPAVNVPASSI